MRRMVALAAGVFLASPTLAEMPERIIGNWCMGDSGEVMRVDAYGIGFNENFVCQISNFANSETGFEVDLSCANTIIYEGEIVRMDQKDTRLEVDYINPSEMLGRMTDLAQGAPVETVEFKRCE